MEVDIMAKRFWPVPDYSEVTSGFGARWGTQHRGVDFGKKGGSANMPVHAAQSGTVVYAGAASGFGAPDPAGWLVIDHPAEAGSGTTVYGHIIREVKKGDWVEAGQRIGRVNPDSNTNGGVAPHLHFEVHPTVWVQGSQIDPLPWLQGAAHPGAAPPKDTRQEDSKRLIFGIDISNWQPSIDLRQVRNEGFEYVFIKASQGDYYRDPYFARHLREAKAAGLLVGAYIYIESGSSAQAQVDVFHSVVNDTSIPVALDIEDGAGGDANLWRGVKDRLEAIGYRVILTYLPRWYWKKVGSPPVHGLPPLWTSAYPDYTPGYASVIYERAKNIGVKDNATGWHGYGGLNVSMYQFTSTAIVAGHKIDANAFKGSRADLERLFKGEKSTEEVLNMPNVLDMVKDIWIQVRHGWPQLGQNSRGENLTLVDGVAALRKDVSELSKIVKELSEKK